MTRKPELLAPAGSWEAFVAAVQNGADAVYLGGKLFNARASASNFDQTELARAVEYAHTRGVKIHVTVNIILADDELTEALHFLHSIHSLGVDAAIVQDLGLARLARQVLPELPLHASTQITVHNIPGVQMMQAAGFDRIVLAREMDLTGIAAIKQTTGAELETFVHGALCICYSGQCLLSSMIGGRSGNRGRCAQPCRMPYTLVDDQGHSLTDTAQVGNFLLSPRDLNLSAHLPDLIKAGIDSFKIEGRMKRPEYVATVIRVYRHLLDRAAAGGDFSVDQAELRDLTQIFNRDFSTGYFYGNLGRDLMSYKRPNNRGIRLGRVKGFNGKSVLVEVALEEPLHLGDGIEVWVSEGGRTGIEVHNIYVNGRQVEEAPAGTVVGLEIPGKIRQGDRVFKTNDAQLMLQARETYTSLKETQKIPVDMFVQAMVGQPLHLTMTDNEGCQVSGSTTVLGQEAIKRPLTQVVMGEQLDRLGNTPFKINHLQCDIQGNVMVPVKEINELRRNLVAKLEKKRLDKYKHTVINEHIFNSRLQAGLNQLAAGNIGGKAKQRLAVVVTELTALKAAVSYGADIVYFGGEYYHSRSPVGERQIKEAVEFCRNNTVSLVLSTPRITQDTEIKQFLNLVEQVSQLPLAGILASNLGLTEVMRNYTDLPLIADFPLNIYNRATVKFFQEKGAVRAVLSPELTLKQVQELTGHSSLPLEIIVHGALPLMVSEYCPVGSIQGGRCREKSCSKPCRGHNFFLRDRMGLEFSLQSDQFCHMHLFNAKELCLIDDLTTLLSTNAAVLRIEARQSGPEYVAKVVRAYRESMERFFIGYPDQRKDLEAKEELAGLSRFGITKGHYYRGVI